MVSRTARKDNSSDYYVNGKKKPFKEVAQLLRECGIDLDHNRFLILQVLHIVIISHSYNIIKTTKIVGSRIYNRNL